MPLATSAIAAVLPVTDTSRAKDFYDKLELSFLGTTEEGSLLYQLSGGAALMLLPREAGTQNPSTALTWEVPDVRAEIASLETRGVRFEDYDLPGLKTVEHIAEMGGTRSAWFLDPDGNVLGLHEGGLRGE